MLHSRFFVAVHARYECRLDDMVLCSKVRDAYEACLLDLEVEPLSLCGLMQFRPTLRRPFTFLASVLHSQRSARLQAMERDSSRGQTA